MNVGVAVEGVVGVGVAVDVGENVAVGVRVGVGEIVAVGVGGWTLVSRKCARAYASRAA